MSKEIVHVPSFRELKREDGKPLAPISSGVKANGFVFVSGMPPVDHENGGFVSGDIQAQTRKSLENVQAVLEAAGSSLDKVVKTTVYCTNSGYYQQVNDVYREFFPDDPPARTFVTVASWPMAFDIEIECVALE